MQSHGILQNTKLNDFEVNFSLELFHLVLSKAEVLFKILQKKSCDIMCCESKIQNLKNFPNSRKMTFKHQTKGLLNS